MPLCGYLFERTFGFRLQSDLLLYSNFTRVVSFREQFSGIVTTRTASAGVIVGYTPGEIILGLPT